MFLIHYNSISVTSRSFEGDIYALHGAYKAPKSTSQYRHWSRESINQSINQFFNYRNVKTHFHMRKTQSSKMYVTSVNTYQYIQARSQGGGGGRGVPGPPQATQGIVNTVFLLYCGFNFLLFRVQSLKLFPPDVRF